MIRYAWLAMVLLLTSCSSRHTPLDSEAGAFGQNDSEKRLIAQSREIRTEFEQKGLILNNADINNYVAKLGASLVPPQAASKAPFRFYVLRDPQINAFATPSGDVFVNLGLIARLENELQLAQVLAHEIGHIVLRHSYEAYENQKSSRTAAHIADLALLGTQIAYLPFVASMQSYSREKETEADRYAVERLAAVGYDVTKTGRLFDVLNETKKGEEAEGSIWSDHPASRERKAYVASISAGIKPVVGGRVGEAEYLPIRHIAVMENLSLKLFSKQYGLSAELAQRELKVTPRNAMLYYYQGEAYRLIAEDPESAAKEYAWVNHEHYSDALKARFAAAKQAYLDNAFTGFNNALALDPNLIDAYKGRGLVHRLRGDKASAAADLRIYLSRSSNPFDRKYMAHLVEELSR